MASARRGFVDVRAHFPLTIAHLGPQAPPAAATPAEFARKVCDAASRGDILDRATRDLVNYEAALVDLPLAPRPDPTPPRDDEPVVIATHVRVLVFGASLPEVLAALREGKPAKPRPNRGWLIAWRDASGVRELEVPRVEGWFLESFREPTPPKEAIEDAQDRGHFEHLWRVGVLVRASTAGRDKKKG